MKILGLNITRGIEKKENPIWPSVLAYVGSQSAVYTPVEYGPLTKAGYQMCASAYSAVTLIARSAAGISWVVLRKRSDGTYDELEEHPLLDLLANPNENDDGYRLVEAAISYKLLAGNSYLLKVGVGTQPPRYLYTLRPDRMAVIPGDARQIVGGYRYTVNGRATPFTRDEVLHIKDFHPLNDFYGLSRLEVAAKSIDISNWSEEWNLKSLQNDMRLSGLLRLAGMTPEKSQEVRRILTERHAGATNAGKALVLENATEAEWTSLSMTPKDADWSESDKRNLRRICSIFNVSSELMGDSENKTYSNIQEARKALYHETVLPEMDGLKNALNRWLVPLYGDNIRLDYDRDGIEALQEDRGAKYAYLDGANFLTVNEKREACGYDEVPNGDVILTSFSDIPLEQISQTVYINPDLTGDDGKTRRKSEPVALGGFWRGANERKALWQNFERRVASKERAFAREMREYLRAQAASVVSKVRAGATAEELLDRDEAEKSYIKRFGARYARLFLTALAAGQRMTEGKLYEFDDADDGKSIASKALTDDVRKKLEALINSTAEVITDETLAEIQDVLRTSLDSNLTTTEIANALRDELDTMSGVRSNRIARTETAMLENCGNLEGFKETGFVTHKGWMCSFVPASRDTHMDEDSVEVPVDDYFTLSDGDRLMYPGDRSLGASAGNVVNCLCGLYPAME